MESSLAADLHVELRNRCSEKGISGMQFSDRPTKWAKWLRPLLAVPLALLILSVNGRAADDTQALFKEKCVMCHGADGAGNTPAGKAMKTPDLTGPEMRKESADQFADAIQKGKGKMPAIKNLTAPQVKQLVEYCRQFAKS